MEPKRAVLGGPVAVGVALAVITVALAETDLVGVFERALTAAYHINLPYEFASPTDEIELIQIMPE